MKRLGEFIFDDSSSEEEDDDDFKRAMCVMLKDEIHSSILVSQFGHLYINQDRGKGHAKLMRRLHQAQRNLSGEVFSPSISDAKESLHHYCKSRGEA
jgi:hypothetical protein